MGVRRGTNLPLDWDEQKVEWLANQKITQSNKITDLQDKIVSIINANTLPNDFGTSSLKEEDILTIAKEIEALFVNENKGIDHAIETLRTQAEE